jgi:hypothetical protein
MFDEKIMSLKILWDCPFMHYPKISSLTHQFSSKILQEMILLNIILCTD